jgi:hypothetical protein
MTVQGSEQQIIDLFKALIKAQSEFPKIVKTKNAYNYKYAPLDEIIDQVGPILHKHGLAVINPIDERGDGKQSVGTMLLHDQGGYIFCSGLTVSEVIKMQEQGGQVTYGRRYGYCGILGITSQDDDDAAVSSKSPRRASNAPRRDGVAQDGIAPLVAAKVATPAQSSGDSGSSPDPSLPNKAERIEIASKLTKYRQHVSDDLLEEYLLKASGAKEVRLIKKEQWKVLLEVLEKAIAARKGQTVGEVLIPILQGVTP